MYELQSSAFHRVAPLFENPPYGPTIPNSVIAGLGPGRVFVDDEVAPTAALVYNNGACTLAGSADRVAFGQAACRWLLEYHDSDYFILYAFPEAWERLLDRELVNSVIKRRRFDFDFEPSKFALLEGWKRSIPDGYRLQRLDHALMEHLRDEVLPYSRNYWRSAADFERHGVGFCLTHHGEMVSVCYTCFAWNDHHDIDIMTTQDHRRQGLAFVVACAFIDHCLNTGLSRTGTAGPRISHRWNLLKN